MNFTNSFGECPYHAQLSAQPTVALAGSSEIFPLTEAIATSYALQEYREYLQEFRQWLEDFICKPHADLGRPGAVCPFVARSLKLGQVFAAIQPETALSLENMKDI